MNYFRKACILALKTEPRIDGNRHRQVHCLTGFGGYEMIAVRDMLHVTTRQYDSSGARFYLLRWLSYGGEKLLGLHVRPGAAIWTALEWRYA